ncbi:MAG: DUF1254 domain-containing protein [Desulfotalea sp.]
MRVFIITFSILLLFTSTGFTFEYPVNFQDYDYTTEEYRKYETSIHFDFYTNKIGKGVNKFWHADNIISVETQSVPRTNNDTLYSTVVIDTREGATFTLPDTGDRYISAIIFDELHYPYGMIHKPGEHKVEVASDYAFIIIRTAVNSTDSKDIKYVTEVIQPQIKVKAKSHIEYTPPKYDSDKLTKLRKALTAEGVKLANFSDLYHEHEASLQDKEKEWQGLLATTVAWGIIPATESTFIMKNPQLPADRCYTATYQVPPHNAFWSITLYDKESMIFSNTNSILNEDNVVFNKDGSFTAFFGSVEQCGDVNNRVDTVEGFNYLMRVYKATMDKLPTYEENFPELEEVKK